MSETNQLHFVLKQRADEVSQKNLPKPLFGEVHGHKSHRPQHIEYMTNQELEELKHRLLANSYTMYGSDLGKLFHEIDLDHKGMIQVSELSHAVKKLIPDINDHEIAGLMQVADLNGNSVLDRHEFFEFMGHRDSLLPTSHHQSHHTVKGRNYLDENIKYAQQHDDKMNTSTLSHNNIHKDKQEKNQYRHAATNAAGMKAKYVSPYILDAQKKARQRAKKSKALLDAQRQRQQQQQKNEWDSSYNHQPGLFDPSIKMARNIAIKKSIIPETRPSRKPSSSKGYHHHSIMNSPGSVADDSLMAATGSASSPNYRSSPSGAKTRRTSDPSTSSVPSYQHMLEKLANHSQTIEIAVLEKLKHKLLACAYRTYGPDLHELFTSIDKDHNGYISLQELKHTVKSIVPDLSDDEINQIMSQADQNGDGKLQFHELCEFLGHRNSINDPKNHHYHHQHHYDKKTKNNDGGSSSSSSSSSSLYDGHSTATPDQGRGDHYHDNHHHKILVVDRGSTAAASSSSSSSHMGESKHASPTHLPTTYSKCKQSSSSSSSPYVVQLETRSTSPFASNVLKNILGDDYIADAEYDDDMGMIDVQSSSPLGNTTHNNNSMKNAQVEFLNSITQAINCITDAAHGSHAPSRGRSASSPRPPASGFMKEVNTSRNTIQDKNNNSHHSTATTAAAKKISFDSPIRQLPKPQLEQLMRTKQKEIIELENSISKLMDKSSTSLGLAGANIADSSGIFPNTLNKALRSPSPRRQHHGGQGQLSPSVPHQYVMDSAVKLPYSTTASDCDKNAGLYLHIDDDDRQANTSVAATAAYTNTDYLVAPAIINTFEANEALSSVFGVTGKGGGLEDNLQNIKNPEQLRLRRVFNKSAHGTLAEEIEPGHAGYEGSRKHPTLHKVRPDSKLEDIVYKYRKDMERVKKLKSVPFRGAGLDDIMRNVADNIGEDFIDALTQELDTIFDDYANKFVGEI